MVQQERVFLRRDAIQEFMERAALKSGCLSEFLDGEKQVVRRIHRFWARILAIPDDPEWRKPAPVVECEMQ